ncbi:MAG: DUF2283 domain-containing protein [Anaerolineae bacterium]
MEKQLLNPALIENAFKIAPLVKDFPTSHLWLDYDCEADVLYISFKRPQQATHSEMLDEVGVLLNYRGEELVGMTIFEASKR